MRRHPHDAAARLYRGLWGVLASLFKVPQDPPTLPAQNNGSVLSFRPSAQYLRYLKLFFWVAAALAAIAVAGGVVGLVLTQAKFALYLAIPAAVLLVASAVIAYVAIHLRYDTMWYVMTARSLRCRRGVWTVAEHTITFENVQNVRVRRGPIQYFFKIATIVVETAGSGETGDHHDAICNTAIIEGIEDANQIRELIMERARRSQSAGLGDEQVPASCSKTVWDDKTIAVLREIRDRAVKLS